MTTATAPLAQAGGEQDQPQQRAEGARLSLAQWFGLSIGGLLLVAIAGVIAGLLALSTLSDRRNLLFDTIGPANTASLNLTTSLLNEETGVRGYALSADTDFLKPYAQGLQDQRTQEAILNRLAKDPRLGLESEVQAVQQAAEAWRTGFATPTIERIRNGGTRPTDAVEQVGKARFDDFRAVNQQLRDKLEPLRLKGRADLSNAANLVRGIFIGFGVILLLAVVAAAVTLRRVVVSPISSLAGGVRDVAQGRFDRRVEAGGAREVRELGRDVDDMRRRIVDEIDQLQVARDDLSRSNAELEQFAYVASHDLQEPLRKVASFCQMLQRRYGGQLDERGEQYIEFAVDGAKRMQDLINDLLAFSRVGRVTEAPTVVACEDLMDRVKASLADAIDRTGATIETGPLPRVRGEASLLGLVFQNLVANGLKFQEEGVPPHVRLNAERDGRMWRFTVQDNGIGIEEEYADRIFIIFQRLHPRSAYEGTGIGLAMCRKVIEYHGGTIWLDTTGSGGATFHFTLPVLEEEL